MGHKRTLIQFDKMRLCDIIRGMYLVSAPPPGPDTEILRPLFISGVKGVPGASFALMFGL